MTRVLLDCDGVICSWTDAVAKVVRSYGGEFDDTKWFDQKTLPYAIRSRVMATLAREGFCSELEPLPGAIDGVKALMAAGCEVHFVTSLWNSPTWAYDRQRWLQRHGLLDSYSRLVFAKDKYVVKGDIFVDDKPSNVASWKAHWPNGLAVLWAQPWNADVTNLHRFNDWNKLLNCAIALGANQQ
jgi:5'(3')-deoxyribonucleotidase